jgi:N-acetylglucosamine kinase-like BadF-type ATPase
MTFVLGLDSGGTKTRAVHVAQDGSVIWHRRFDGIDPTDGPSAQDPLGTILAQCGTPVAATLGLPYHGEIATVSAQQTRIATGILGLQTQVRNDVDLAHLGAFSGLDGVLILAGTGSMAWARGPAGVARAGGYGDLIGDEGSAFWIGQEALRLTAMQIDGRAADTGFAEAVCKRIGITPDQLIDWVYTRPKPRVAIAALAFDVSALSTQGHHDARAILLAAADALYRAARAARKRAGLDPTCRWSVAGGVLADPVVADAIAVAMRRPADPARLSPVGGAALDAARRAGWQISDRWIACLSAGLAEFESSATASRFILKG